MSATLQPIPEWSSRTLQGLAYWLGYQDAFGIADQLNEGAIATEVMRLIVAHGHTPQAVEAEVYYKHVPETKVARRDESSGARADLVVASAKREDRKEAFRRLQVSALVEVKHGRSQPGKIDEDLDRLSENLAGARRSLRGFLVYAALTAHPRFVNAVGRAEQGIKRTKNGTRFRVRRVCRAVPGSPRPDRRCYAGYAVLVEVLR